MPAVDAEWRSNEGAAAFRSPHRDDTIDDTVHILLADDNPYDIDLIGLALHEAGTPNLLRVATDGADALSFLRAVGHSEIDLVLFELDLPVVDGFELLEEVRRRPDHDRVMMVALTSSEHAQDRDQAYATGVDGYIRKTPDYDELVRRLDDLLAQAAG